MSRALLLAFYLLISSIASSADFDDSRFSVAELLKTQSVFVIRWQGQAGSLKPKVFKILRGDPPGNLSFLIPLGRLSDPGGLMAVAVNDAFHASNFSLQTTSVSKDGKLLVVISGGEKAKQITLEKLEELLKPKQK